MQMEGRGLSWLSWEVPGSLTGLVPTFPALGLWGLWALHLRTTVPADLGGPFQPGKRCFSRKMLKMSLLLSPHLQPTIPEMEQPSRWAFLWSHYFITHDHEGKGKPENGFILLGTVLETRISTVYHRAAGGNPLNSKGAALAFKEFLEDRSIWKFSTLVTNPVNYHLI